MPIHLVMNGPSSSQSYWLLNLQGRDQKLIKVNVLEGNQLSHSIGQTQEERKLGRFKVSIEIPYQLGDLAATSLTL